MNPPECKSNISHMFVTAHSSAIEISDRMMFEIKRHNYITPTHYLQLVNGYVDLLAEKRADIGKSRDKLKNGLQKVDETRVTVEEMSVTLAESKKKVRIVSL